MPGFLNLQAKCHINENGDGDRFVGIKADSENQRVFFPMGYNLPETEEEIRQDILRLIDVLAEFCEDRDKLLQMEEFERPQSVNYPINAYMNIIRYYMANGYYKEKVQAQKTSDHGPMDFTASLHRNHPIYQEDGSPYFPDGYTVRTTVSTDNAYITRIHQYCVFEAYRQMGWLFSQEAAQDPHVEFEHDKFIDTLNRKLKNTNNSGEKELFLDMIKMIEFLDDPENRDRFYFGTDRFEYVWEKLIDRVFGIKEKKDYFPHTYWRLASDTKKNAALEPDTIMLVNNKIYVLDAKYYRFGITGMVKHLPESTSINKQITYGEYIYNHHKFKAMYGDDVPVYNAFLMPYNRAQNPFAINDYFGYIGEATSDWKYNSHEYERVQGIVVDIRWLMSSYRGGNKSKIRKMAEAIDKALAENGGHLPTE